MSIESAYEECERITREEARNFHYGIRLLAPQRRRSLCALYALARRIDDIGDEEAPLEQKTVELEDVRAQLAQLDQASDPVLVAVRDSAQHFPVPLEAFGELIDGVEMDLRDEHYDTFEELTLYCRRVAGSIGRLCLAIFGNDADPRAALYADQLGIALQQTNILRDIREDLLLGRVYLPAQELKDFGVDLRLDEHGALADPDARLAAYISFAAGRADHWYQLGERLLPHLDRRSAACCSAMSQIYHRLLGRISDNPTQVYDARLSLPALEKGRVVIGALSRTVLR